MCLEGPAPNGEDVPCSSCSLQDQQPGALRVTGGRVTATIATGDGVTEIAPAEFKEVFGSFIDGGGNDLKPGTLEASGSKPVGFLDGYSRFA